MMPRPDHGRGVLGGEDGSGVAGTVITIGAGDGRGARGMTLLRTKVMTVMAATPSANADPTTYLIVDHGLDDSGGGRSGQKSTKEHD